VTLARGRKYSASPGFSSAHLQITGKSNPYKPLFLGFDTTLSVGVMLAGVDFASWNNLALNPEGGNVGIGTTNPNTLATDEHR